MPTKVRTPSTVVNEGKPVRVIGKIAKDMTEFVAKPGSQIAGQVFRKLSVVVDDGFGTSTWVNATVFPDLFNAVVEAGAGDIFKKGSYAKFIGKATLRPWTDKEGAEQMSKDLLVSGIELQNGSFIKGMKDKEPGENEDAF